MPTIESNDCNVYECSSRTSSQVRSTLHCAPPQTSPPSIGGGRGRTTYTLRPIAPQIRTSLKNEPQSPNAYSSCSSTAAATIVVRSHDRKVSALVEARLSCLLTVRAGVALGVVLQRYDTEVDGEPRVRSVVMSQPSVYGPLSGFAVEATRALRVLAPSQQVAQ